VNVVLDRDVVDPLPSDRAAVVSDEGDLHVADTIAGPLIAS
jgi:hypothetical protein